MKKNRSLSLILALLMLLTAAFPVSVFAEDFFFEDEMFYDEGFDEVYEEAPYEEEFFEELPEEIYWEDEVTQEEPFVDEWVYEEEPAINEESAIIEEEIVDETVNEVIVEEEEVKAAEETVEETTGLVLSDSETYDAGPTITQQPQPIEGKVGDTVTLSVEATAKMGTLAFQWQYKKPGAPDFVDATNEASRQPSWTFKLTTSMDGRTYRCKVTDGDGTSYSSEVTVKVTKGIEITKQPENIVNAAGQNATLSVEATGATSYQWQYKKPGATAWTTSTNVASQQPSWTFKLTTSMDGRTYRCVLSNGGEPVYTNEVTVTIGTVQAIEITKQPENIVNKAGQNATLSVEATGATSYQWQYKKPDTTKWISASSEASQQPSWTFKLTTSMDGRTYRCVLSNGGEPVYTNEVTVTIGAAQITVGDFVFEPLSDTTCTLVKYNGAGETVTVPAVEGYTVTEIGEGAFEGNTTLESITLPSTITAIRARAFKGCTNLSTMK